MNQLEAIQRAVEMTAMCERVEHDVNTPTESRWMAVLLCNAANTAVIGHGPDAWTAVQAAHALRKHEEDKRS